MSISRDIQRNIRVTNELIQSDGPIERKDPSWLGNGSKGGIIDYELLRGATLEELVERSGRTKNSVVAHIQHLRKVQGLEIENQNGIYQFVNSLKNKTEEKNTLSLNDILFQNHFVDYIAYCNRSQWLKYREAYKFKFGRWLSSRVDFNNMDNEAILKACIDSQNQEYDFGEKGVNFIKSGLQYHDDFITLNDIIVLRKLHNGGVLDNDDLKGSPLSFPKFSVWAGILVPDNYKIYANEELTKGIAFLFDLENYPKSGVKAFNLANNALNILSLEIVSKYASDIKELISLIFPDENDLKPSDLSWFTQDFILFLNRRVLDKEVSYYWVNQGTQYDNELKYNCIAATTGKLHHHKRLKGMMEGDVIINYANSNIRATSIVINEFEIKPRPYLPEGDDDLIVGVKYTELDNPISIEKIKSLFKNHEDLLPKKYSPFNHNLRVNQSYCLDFNEESYSLIFNKKNISDNIVEEERQKISLMKKPPLNQILYGPPGTGKTYNTKEKAVQIIDGSAPEDRVSLNKRFEELVDDKKIVFTTFHQSMSYEDFVEGIKPKILDSNEQEGETDLIYEIKNGILKEIIDKINDEEDLLKSKKENLYLPDEKFNQPINKVSLGNSLIEEDQGIYDYCLENNCIAIGFGEDIDFTGVKNRIDIRNRYKDAGIEISNSMDFSISAIERLVIWMKPGQLVFVSNGNRKLKAIGEVTGDYYYNIDTPIKYSQFREVKWLHTDLDIPIKEIYGKFFSQQTIYQIDPKQINKDFFLNQSLVLGNKESNYVLIIDEINRGNVSQIFGELITLLEEDKRKGNKEALSVQLPYSKKEFTVPNNLYVIGTMNTADRSVEALDTALRRRFSFQEIMPDPDLLDNSFVDEFSLKDILKRINERIEVLIDRDHTIGHSYFMELNDSIEQLKLVFKDKIIPLLQEYFYGDYGKIGLVLGNGFVSYQPEKSELFANFNNYERKDELNNGFYILKTIDENFDLTSALNELLNINTEEIEESD